MGRTEFARKLVIGRRYYDLPDLPPKTYYRSAGADGVVLEDWKTNTWYPYCGVKMTEQELRFYLTYFDQIDVPCIPEIDYSDENMDSLISLGFIERSTYYMPEEALGWPMDEYLWEFSDAPYWALRDKLEAEPGVWSFADRGSTPKPLERGLHNILEIELYSCLPIPTSDTSFTKILKFKEQYSSELDHLRLSLYHLYEQVLHSQDTRLAVHAAKATINVAVADVMKALKGRRIQTNLISLKTEFSIEDLGTMAGATGTLVATGVPLEFAVVGGVAAAALRINLGGKTEVPTSQKSSVDFAYIAQMQRKLHTATG